MLVLRTDARFKITCILDQQHAVLPHRREAPSSCILYRQRGALPIPSLPLIFVFLRLSLPLIFVFLCLSLPLIIGKYVS